LVIKENQKHRVISYTIRLNKRQSAICPPLYKRKSFKYWKFNQPFEIKADNLCNPWEWRPQNYPGTEEIRSQIVKEISLFEATKRSNNFEKLGHVLITTQPTPEEPERTFSATRLSVKKFRNKLNDDNVLNYHASIL